MLGTCNKEITYVEGNVRLNYCIVSQITVLYLLREVF